MSAAESMFPARAAEELPPLVDVKRVIETVGVEVVESSPTPAAEVSKVPANHNDVVPFAATLTRIS